MKTKLKFMLLLALAFLPLFLQAADHPETHLGQYGIQYYPTLAEYQQHYVGQVVKYLPQLSGGSYLDQEHFIKEGGKLDTEYVITKITGNDDRMTFLLTEKGGKDKVKMVVNNKNLFYSYGKNWFCITKEFTVPLLLSEKFAKDKQQYVGKVYPSNPDSPIHVEVTDVVLQSKDKDSYPSIFYVLTDQKDGKTFNYNADDADELNDLGKVFTNPKYNCSYTVVNVFKKSDWSYTLHKREDTKFYTVKNSIDGKTKDVKASSARIDAFKYDDSGRFNATLTKVEKPSNSSIRYGKTTSVTEKDITKYSYVDNFIDILIFASNKQFNFILKNVSPNTIKVVWNEAVFVDVDGSTSKVMHSGIKYSQREGDQPASTIIKGAKLEDLAAPTDKVYYSDAAKEWTSKSLFSSAKTKEKGQTLRLMLPIQVKEVVNEYIFEFTLNYEYTHPEYLSEEYFK